MSDWCVKRQIMRAELIRGEGETSYLRWFREILHVIKTEMLKVFSKIFFDPISPGI